MKKTILKKASSIIFILLALAALLSTGAAAEGERTLQLWPFLYSPRRTTTPISVVWGPELFEIPATAMSNDLMVVSSISACNAYADAAAAVTLEALGFEDTQWLAVGRETSAHYIYAMLAQQTMQAGGEDFRLVAVALRGTIDPEEWASCFAIGNDEYVNGFHQAEQALYATLQAYLAEHPSELPLKFWITGHSRGAAIANLLAAELSDVAAKEDVYAYTFATPNVVRVAPGNETRYGNIWNFVSPLDLVPCVPLASWGYGKYGTTIELPNDSRFREDFTAFTGGPYKDFLTEDAFRWLLRLLSAAMPLPVYNSLLEKPLQRVANAAFSLESNACAAFGPGLKLVEGSLLKPIVHNHTPETYVAQAMVLAASDS